MEGLRAPHARVEKVQASRPKREMKPAVLFCGWIFCAGRDGLLRMFRSAFDVEVDVSFEAIGVVSSRVVQLLATE